jgi:hypothetical protein
VYIEAYGWATPAPLNPTNNATPTTNVSNFFILLLLFLVAPAQAENCFSRDAKDLSAPRYLSDLLTYTEGFSSGNNH